MLKTARACRLSFLHSALSVCDLASDQQATACVSKRLNREGLEKGRHFGG